MTSRADGAAALDRATDRLLEACTGAACVRVEPEPPFDALAAGVAALSRIYDRAAARPRRPRRTKS